MSWSFAKDIILLTPRARRDKTPLLSENPPSPKCVFSEYKTFFESWLEVFGCTGLQLHPKGCKIDGLYTQLKLELSEFVLTHCAWL